MSVFTGLSRLRNSFRKKRSKFYESVKKNGNISDSSATDIPSPTSSPKTARNSMPSPKTARGAISSPKTSRVAISSPKTARATASSPKTSQVAISSPKISRVAISSPKNDNFVETVVEGLHSEQKSHDGNTSPHSNHPTSTLSSEHQALMSSSPDTSHYSETRPEANEDELLGPTEMPASTVDGSAEADLETGMASLEQEVASVVMRSRTKGSNQRAVSDSANDFYPSFAQCNSTLRSNTSLKSSSTSTITATNRHSKPDSCHGTEDFAAVADLNHSVGNACKRKSVSFSEMSTFDSSLDLDELYTALGVMNKSASNLEIGDFSNPVLTASKADDYYRQRSVLNGNSAVRNIDDSYESLQFADAVDSPLDSPDRDVSLEDAEEEILRDNEQDNCSSKPTQQTASISDLTPTSVLRKPRSSHPNRVSFGANLQEVLGKAEEARSRKNSPEKDITPSAHAACEIPPSLTGPLSTSMYGVHKDPAEDITCRVCNNLFRQPRILPCLHTFCTACIVDLQTYPINVLEDKSSTCKEVASEDSRELLSPSPAQGSTSSSSFSQRSVGSLKSDCSSARNSGFGFGGDRLILCPTCLRETRVSPTLDGLPVNYVAERRVAQQESKQGGVGGKMECDSCGDLSASSSVLTARCVECAENLCTLCELSHRRQKKTKRHQLIDFSFAQGLATSQHSINKKRDQNHVIMRVPPPRLIYCSIHDEEELKLFCMTCDLPVCRDCVVVDHRDHDCQFLCQELFRGQMGRIQGMIEAVVPRISAVDQQLKKISDTQEQIRSRADDVMHEINTYMDNFLDAIEQHRQQLLEQVTVVVEEKQHTLHVTERHLRHVRGDVEQTCRFVSDLIDNASDVEILLVKHLVTERLTGLKNQSAVQHQPVSSFIKFSASEKGQVINNFQMFGRVLSRKASASASIIFSEGLSTARVSHESSVVLRVNSEDGTPYTAKDVQVKAWIIFQNQSIKSIPVRFVVQRNGTYSVKFTPVHSGTHYLHVAVDSQPVKDSPFKFKVKGPWREHRGVWHCCTACSTGSRDHMPCACRGVMPGGQNQGCSHGDPGHPGGHHWSCCAKMTQKSECSGVPMPSLSPVRQVTL